MNINTIEIGMRIRAQREKLHMTRADFSEMIDVTPKFCSDIETGAKGMSINTLVKISKFLDVSTDYLLFGGGNGCKSDFTIFAESVPSDESDFYLRICREIAMLTKLKK